MNGQTHFKIEYLLQGKPKSFYMRASRMDASEAWHMSAVDAGFGHIPRFRSDPRPKVSRPKAELLGITEVVWQPA